MRAIAFEIYHNVGSDLWIDPRDGKRRYPDIPKLALPSAHGGEVGVTNMKTAPTF